MRFRFNDDTITGMQLQRCLSVTREMAFCLIPLAKNDFDSAVDVHDQRAVGQRMRADGHEHDGIETDEISGRSHERCSGSQLLEALTVHVECPLQGEDSNGPADSRSGGVRSPVRHIAG